MGKTDLDIIKAKVNAFRVSEAKEVLHQLGLSRSGNKPDLIGRILSVFSDAAALNADGYRPRDMGRQELAASIIDRVHKDQVSQGHISSSVRRVISDLEQKTAAGSGAAGLAAAVDRHSNKKQRINGGSEALQDGSAVHDVIKAFLTGSDALSNTKVRCICSEFVERGQMLQCEGAFCGVWQHAACVRQHMRNMPVPAQQPNSISRQQFFCERCRIARADPYWEIFDATVMPPAVASTFVRNAGVITQMQQHMTVAFHSTGLRQVVVNKSNVMLLRAKPQEYRLMAMCIQLDDVVPFRIHWPLHVNLSFESLNGSMISNIRVNQRLASAKLGINQRDEGCDLRQLLPATGGTNAAGMIRKGICLELADSEHTYLLLVYMMRRRSAEQVKALMKPPEQLTHAVQRICRHMHGGHLPLHQQALGSPTAPAAAGQHAANGDANGVQTIDSDSDDDIIIGNIVVSLKDPMSGARMSVPARFTDTAGTAPSAFDLDTYLDMVHRSKKWLDPHNQEPSTAQSLQVDSYLSHILTCLEQVPDVTEIEINSEGHWRPAGSSSVFMSVLEQRKDMAAAAAEAAAAARTVGQVAAAAAAAGSEDDDDDDPAAELRRAAAEFAAANAASRRAKSEPAAMEVIDLVSDDEDDAQAAAQSSSRPAAAAGPVAAQLEPLQPGLRIRLPLRPAQQQLQQQPIPGVHQSTQQHTQQQQQQQQMLGMQHLQQQQQPHQQQLPHSQQHLQQRHLGVPTQLVPNAQQLLHQQHVRSMHLPVASLAMQGSLPTTTMATGSAAMQQHIPHTGHLGVTSGVDMQQHQGFVRSQMPIHGGPGMQYIGSRPMLQQPQLGQMQYAQQQISQPGSPAAYVQPAWAQQQRPVFQQVSQTYVSQPQQHTPYTYGQNIYGPGVQQQTTAVQPGVAPQHPIGLPRIQQNGPMMQNGSEIF